MDSSSQRASEEPRLFRERAPVNHASLSATAYSAERSHATDYDEPETTYYVDRDPWYTQSQSGRPCPETEWGYRTTMPRSVPMPNAMMEPACPILVAPGEESTIHGAGRHPVPLDAPDVALQGQRLLAYGEWLRQEEAEVVNLAAGCARHPARPCRPMARQQWPEAAERQMAVPPAAGGRDDIRAVEQPRPLRAEERIYVEPPGVPEIGRRPLDLDAGQPIFGRMSVRLHSQCQYAERHQFTRTTRGLHMRPGHPTEWEYQCSLAWPNWIPPRARTGRDWTILSTRLRTLQLSTRGTKSKRADKPELT